MTGVSSWFGRSPTSDAGGSSNSNDNNNKNNKNTQQQSSSSLTGSQSTIALTKELLQALEPPPRPPAPSRFSQLLLEHGETALQDWAVTAFSSALKSSQQSQQQQPQHQALHMLRSQGRLHLCTRSLVFEPTELSRAIVRLPFTCMAAPPSLGAVPKAATTTTSTTTTTTTTHSTFAVHVTTQKHVLMKENNIIAPFVHVKQPCAFQFVLQHSSPEPVIQAVEQLYHQACTTDTTNTDNHHSTVLPSASTNEAAFLFSTDNLLSVRESLVLSNIKAAIKTPLASQSVVLAISNERLYLQPVVIAQQPQQGPGTLSSPPTRPATKFLLRDIIATARRYNGLRDSAIQIYFKGNTAILIALERRHEREQVLRALPNVICFTDKVFVELVAKEWMQGKLSNYHYLLALNSAAGRTFYDLGRYPVFPWVIQDYKDSTAKLDLQNSHVFRDLTKPMGALNPERLDYFKQRMNNMQDMGTPFLYGTHYSAPGYVLYYLVRSMPEHMLCLQNGKFDAADRMFFDIQHTFQCALTNHADVKELIPEFYGTDIDFLVNARGLHLGATQNGQRVNDVQLPSWARSARDFLKKNRKALESEACTKALSQWIDLIFGSKSRGEAAAEADNLFHPITYLGPTDLAAMPSERDRHAAELQASEFGCCPDQLFVSAHPRRGDDKPVNFDFISNDIGRASSKEDDKVGRETWELLDAPTEDSQGSNANAPQVVLTEQPTAIVSKTSFALNRETNMEATGVAATATISHPVRTMLLQGKGEQASSNTGSSRVAQHRAPPSLAAAATLSGDSADKSTIWSKSTDTTAGPAEWDMQMIERKHVHNDAISGCVLLLDPQQSLLVTTSLDGGLKVHKLSLSIQADRDDDDERRGFPAAFSRFSYSTILSRGQVVGSMPFQSKLTEYRSHSSRDPLASLVLAHDGISGTVAFAGGHDDVVLAYGVNSGCAVASVYSHRDAVTGLDLISRTPFDPESALWLENSTHIMVSGSWDATVKVWSVCVSKSEAVSISREPLAELFDAESSIVCVSVKSLPDGGIVIAAGCADSSFCAWHVHNDGVQVAIHNEPARRGSGPCSVVKWISVSGTLHLLAAFSTGKVASYSMAGEGLRRDSAVSVGVAVLSLAYTEPGTLLLGCADGCLRLISLQNGAHFDTRPTLWPEVNNKTCPGVTSISTMSFGSGDQSKFLCCTGGSDGSVALFEIKRNKSIN